MSAPAKAHEPTMEEILASIRRIISDDDPAANPAKQAADPVPHDARPPEERRQDDVDEMFAAMDEISGVKTLPDVTAADPLAPPQVQFEDDLDVLELTDEIEQDATFEQPYELTREPEPAFERRTAPERPSPRAANLPAEPDRLLSPGADETVTNAFGNLAHTIMAGNAQTLDDVVREMLRPMLRAWLDDNLPPLVERLVRQEIERVARGGR